MLDYQVFKPRHAAAKHLTDLRSDTVSRPTKAMYEAMLAAPVGDDGLEGDPTVEELESTVARLLGKERGLYVPTCTMANLLATLAHCNRHDQVVLEETAHMFTTERGGSLLAGIAYTPVLGAQGAMDLDRLESTLRPGPSRMKVGLVAIETSHNNAGGTVLPLDHMKDVYGMAVKRGVPVHLDGARVMNAAVALGVSPATVAEHADSVSLCLSKGLSAPVGSVLTGSASVIETARTYRKWLGGTQRQAGVVAAAGLEGVSTMVGRLQNDHDVARTLATLINSLEGPLEASGPQTNIVQIQVEHTRLSNLTWVEALTELGVLVRPLGDRMLRCVTHRHITLEDIDHVCEAFESVLSRAAQERQ